MRSAGKDALLLLVATLAALGAILYGAAFSIAPVFQFGYRTVPYTAPAPVAEEAPGWPIDINTADEALLMQLPGVGPVRRPPSLPTGPSMALSKQSQTLIRSAASPPRWWKTGPG